MWEARKGRRLCTCGRPGRADNNLPAPDAPASPRRPSRASHKQPARVAPFGKGGRRRTAAAGGFAVRRSPTVLSSRANARDLLHRSVRPDVAPRTAAAPPRSTIVAPRSAIAAPRTGNAAPFTVPHAPSSADAAPRNANDGAFFAIVAPRTGNAAPLTAAHATLSADTAPRRPSGAAFFATTAARTVSSAPPTGNPARAPSRLWKRGPTPHSGGGGILRSPQPHRLVIPSEREGPASPLRATRRCPSDPHPTAPRRVAVSAANPTPAKRRPQRLRDRKAHTDSAGPAIGLPAVPIDR